MISHFVFMLLLLLYVDEGMSLPLPFTEDITARKGIVSYHEGFSNLFGDNNIRLSQQNTTVQLVLDRYTGSGFVSQGVFLNGFFSASIKLPKGYTAGIVTAFYMSNGNTFPRNHDELDFEFLGNIRGKHWRVQTNVYGNGSTNVGREERYNLWFDPTQDFHNYSILWTQRHIVFFVDSIPIRELVRREAMGGEYPSSKPMSVYATIWDGSDWATNGGRYKVKYKYAPFTTAFTHLILERCGESASPCNASVENKDSDSSDSSLLSANQMAAMKWFRSRYVTYSYCEDKARYPIPLPECPQRKASSQ